MKVLFAISLPQGWGPMQSEEESKAILERAAAGPDKSPEDIFIDEGMDSPMYEDPEVY